jgi:hypothetical protein
VRSIRIKGFLRVQPRRLEANIPTYCIVFTILQEEEITKKRKLVVEIEKKPEVKKVASKIAKPSHNTARAPAGKSTGTIKQPAAPTSSTAYSTSHPAVPPSATTKGKEKAKAKLVEDEIVDPSQMMQTRMAERLRSQLQAAKEASAPADLASENIELPDINSEYSDSDDENRPRTFDPPGWAQSPELRQALQMQSTMNPDEIFGAIRPLRMEELFRTRTSRFRARTSSANWAGSDRLTAEEEREYVRRMGFR